MLCGASPDGDASGDGPSHEYRREMWFALMVLEDDGPAVPGRIEEKPEEPGEKKRKEDPPGPVH
jgi:hypothetical protein